MSDVGTTEDSTSMQMRRLYSIVCGLKQPIIRHGRRKKCKGTADLQSVQQGV